MTFKTIAGAAALAGLLAASANSTALTVPFTETFTGGAANWLTGPSGAVTLVASGGADGGQYVSQTTNVDGFTFNGKDRQTLFRCNNSADCSGDAFVGNWSSDVDTLSFAIRHNAATPLEFFARIATSGNFPAFAAESTTVVQPNTWTTIAFAIDPGNPLLTPEGPFAFDDVFTQVGILQLGVTTAVGFTAPDVTFDLDLVSVSAVPLPAAAWLMLSAVGGLLGFARRT